MKKDTSSTIRINKKVKEFIKSIGMSEQKIIDEWVGKNIDIEIKSILKTKVKK